MSVVITEAMPIVDALTLVQESIDGVAQQMVASTQCLCSLYDIQTQEEKEEAAEEAEMQAMIDAIAPGTPGNTSPDGTGLPCECQEIQATFTVTQGSAFDPTTNQPYATFSPDYIHTYTYNTCESQETSRVFASRAQGNIIVDFYFDLPGFDQVCFPPEDMVPCECEDFQEDVVNPPGGYGYQFTRNTCVTEEERYVPIDISNGDCGWCSQAGFNATTEPRAIGGTVALDLDGEEFGPVCPPQGVNQESFDDLDPNNVTKWYKFAWTIPAYEAECDQTPTVDTPATTNCEYPCDPFGVRLKNGDGSDICCPCDKENENGQLIRAVGPTGSPLWGNVDFPGQVFAILNTDVPLPNGPTILPLQPEQTADALGWYEAAVYRCDPKDAAQAAQGASSISGSSGKINCGNPTNLAESYHIQWCEWLKCWQNYRDKYDLIYGAQIVASLFQLVESYKCYNKILEEQKFIVNKQANDVEDLRECSAQMLSLQNGLLKQCQESLLKDHVDRIGVINNSKDAVCERAGDLWDCYANTLKPVTAEYAPLIAERLLDAINNGSDSSNALSSLASELSQTLLECMLPDMKAQFQCLLKSNSYPTEHINKWRDQMRDQALHLDERYRETYECSERTMIPEIMRMSECMVSRVCELRDWLASCGMEDLNEYKRTYRDLEGPHARTAITAATKAIPNIEATIQWFEKNIPAYKALYDRCYSQGDTHLNPELFSEIQELAPEVTEVYEWFKERKECYYDFWENCYKDRECRLVKQQLDLAHDLTKTMESAICKLAQWSEEGMDRYQQVFEGAERKVAPKIITRGETASIITDESIDFWVESRQKFFDAWEHKIFPADMNNLQRHQQVWGEGDMLKLIHHNGTDLARTSRVSQDAYRDAVCRAGEYLDEICADKETFEYCLDEPAALHVRKQFDRAREELIRCNSRYCQGYMQEALVRLNFEAAKAEGGAVSAANRWKWWANEQLKDNQFRRKTALLELVNNMGQIGIQASQASTAAYSFLVESDNRSLSRVYEYLNMINVSGSQVSQQAATQLANMQQMIEMGHFWPQYALNSRTAAAELSSGMFSQAQQWVQRGQYYLDRETWAQLNSSKYLTDMLSHSNRMQQVGQFWVQQADAGASQKAATASSLATLGVQHVDQGHRLHRMAGDKVSQAMSASIQAASPGLTATELGQRWEETSLKYQNEALDHAMRHMTLAAALIDSGIKFMTETRNTYESQQQFQNQALYGYVNMFREANNTANIYKGFEESCVKMEFDMLCKAKDYLQDNFRIVQNSIHGTNVGSTANQLGNQLNNNFDQALATLNTSVLNLAGNNAPLPPLASGVGGFVGGIGGSGF